MPADLTRTDRALLAFYRGEGRTDHGYTFDGIIAWADDVWEDVHNYIQWMFPNDQRSAFYPEAPILTPAVIKLWSADPTLQEHLGLAFDRWLRFVGVERDGTGFRFREPTNLEVWGDQNHNWLRITRVLKSLRLLHRGDESRAWFAFLEKTAAPRFGIDEGTLRFWREAAG